MRTAQEERVHLFKCSPQSVAEETPYSANVKRCLSAALALNDETEDLKLIFKSGDTTELDLLLEDDSRQLLIYEKWLDYQASHRQVACQISRLKSVEQRWERDAFCCDYVIETLHDLVLEELSEYTEEEPAEFIEKNRSLSLRISESLRKMLRMVQISPGSELGEIEVSWTDNESNMISKLHGSKMKCQITLHRVSTCSDSRFELLMQESKLTH